MAYDFATMRTVARKVTLTTAHPTLGDRTLVVNGAIHASVNHVFYANGVWKQAHELKPGDVVLGLTASGRAGDVLPRETRISGAEVIIGRRMVYDIEVDGLHNYFADGILVHNGREAMIVISE